MSLPTTITVNVGSPAADVVFDDVNKISGSSLIYSAASPQGDLKGRPSIRFSHETNKAGLVRSLQSVVVPVYDSTTGAYNGFVKADITLNRSERIGVSEAKRVLEIALEAASQTAVNGAFVNALV